MSRLASILYIAGCVLAANAASSVPIATQPVLSTATVSTVSDALSTSFSTFLSTSTVVLYTTVNSKGRAVTSSIGQQLSLFTSTSAVVASEPVTELSTSVATIGSTTIYGNVPTTALTSSNLLASTSTAPAVIVSSSPQAPETTPVNIVTSTASIPAYSTSVATTSSSAASTATASPAKSSKKLSSGAAAGIAIAVALVVGSIAAALIVLLGKRRQQKKWGRKPVRNSLDGESKKDLFSPDARAGYESMWKKPAAITEKGVRPGTANTTSARVSPISHERGDSSTLGMDAPSIAPSRAGTPNTDTFGDKPLAKPVPNFSTPNRRNGSITALPQFD